MPSIEDNRYEWTEQYSWPQAGDEWSSCWGSTETLWWTMLLPRIHRFVPAGDILEIAPGFGRITQYLKNLCQHLVVVDMAERCVEACKKRFASDSHITYHVNDGKTLEMIPERSVDFAFSYDSLVHVEADVMEAYISQLSRILRPDGIAFLHHSNAESYMRPEGDEQARELIVDMWRGQSVSAELCARFGEQSNLHCVSQELINWGTDKPFLIDCFSVFTPQGSSWDRSNRILHNNNFMREALYAASLGDLYSDASFAPVVQES